MWDTPEQRALDVDILRDCYLCDQLRQGAVVRGGYNSDEFQLMSIWLHAFEYRFPDGPWSFWKCVCSWFFALCFCDALCGVGRIL